MTTGADVLKLIEEKGIKYVDLRFTDTKGKEQHVTVPRRMVDEAFFEDGKGFDGSSIAGWKGIQESDMILMPDPTTAIPDPFFDEPTLNLRCDVVEPSTMQGYDRCPRSLAKRAGVRCLVGSQRLLCELLLERWSNRKLAANRLYRQREWL